MPIIKGIRTGPRGTEEVELEWTIRTSSDRKLWIHVLNGPTGYEAMPLASCIEAIERKVPWAANFGNGNYDQLDVPWEELQKILNTPVVELLKSQQ